MSEKIPLLVLNSLSPAHQAQIAAVYDLTYAPTQAERTAAIAARGAKFRAVLTIGVIGITADGDRRHAAGRARVCDGRRLRRPADGRAARTRHCGRQRRRHER